MVVILAWRCQSVRRFSPSVNQSIYLSILIRDKNSFVAVSGEKVLDGFKKKKKKDRV